MIIFVASVALICALPAEEKIPPMFVTLGDGSRTVQVTMAGQTYLEDTVSDGSIVWWQVKNQDGTIIRSRLNRADGSLIITNENLNDDSKRYTLKGFCSPAKNKF